MMVRKAWRVSPDLTIAGQWKMMPAHNGLSLYLSSTLLWLLPLGDGATHIQRQSFLLCSLQMPAKTSQEVCLTNLPGGSKSI